MHQLYKMSKIAIIGGGVIGLSTAVEIQRDVKSADITIFAEKLSPNTTGDVSAGLWSPYLLQKTPSQDIIKWSKITQDYALDVWKQGKNVEFGISLLPIIAATTDNNIPIPEWSKITIGFQSLSKDYLNKLSREHKRKYKSGFTFLTFIIEPSKYLPAVLDEFIRNGGKIVIQRIEELNELSDFDVVVNCSGISSATLINDDKVKPIRGQIARVEAPWQFHVLMDNSENGNYVIPNMECVILGGTHQNEYDLMVRNSDKDFILNGCQNMAPSLKNAHIIKHQVGLRPGRDSVRIDLEIKKIGPKVMKIVHNYGHGGSGVTLCKGCAKDASALVKNALSIKSKI